jgi:hypothetical protein
MYLAGAVLLLGGVACIIPVLQHYTARDEWGKKAESYYAPHSTVTEAERDEFLAKERAEEEAHGTWLLAMYGLAGAGLAVLVASLVVSRIRGRKIRPGADQRSPGGGNPV